MIRKITSMLIIASLIAIVPPLTANAESMPDIPDPNTTFNLNGAGATFPFPLIDLWRVEYNNDYSNVNLNYQSIGSGGGVKQHIEKTVNFAASDKPMSESERELASGTLHIPEAIGGVVVVYNVPEVPNKGLKLTADELFLKYSWVEITKWNDPSDCCRKSRFGSCLIKISLQHIDQMVLEQPSSLLIIYGSCKS